MKKFRFKLQTVLDVKERKEEMLRHELMKLQALKLEQEQLKKKIREEKASAAHEKGRHIGAGCDITRLRQFEEYISALLGQIDRAERQIQKLQAEVSSKRDEVIQDSKETKTFTRLKDRHFDVFKKMVIDNEQKQLDEMAVNKYNRKEQHNY